MAKFLNTAQLSIWIPQIIDETQKELIIITPYMQLSEKIYRRLVAANARGVETVIIYRENKLSDTDRNRLAVLDNLNLLHHPNIHAKCFYNETYLLIGSLNLYEYSEKNNREMSVVFTRKGEYHDDDASIFNDALNEILEIQNGAEMEKQSRETTTEGFELEILKTPREKALERLKEFNKAFGHKKFELDESSEFLNINNRTVAYICKSYFDKVDVKINYRTEFCINLDAVKLEKNFNNYKNLKHELEYRFSGFKFYWNVSNLMLLYDDSKHTDWINIDIAKSNMLKKRGIDEVITFIKNLK